MGDQLADMKLSSVRIKDFKRFTDLTVTDIPATAKLVVIVGPNGAGKSSLFEAFNYWLSVARQNIQFDPLYHMKIGGPAIADWSQMFQRITIAFHDAEINPQTDPQSARKAFYLRSAYRHEPDFSINQLNRADDMLADSRRPITLISGEARVSDNYHSESSQQVSTLYSIVQTIPRQPVRLSSD